MAGAFVVDRTSVREQVHRLLRAQIASGILQPGEIYSAVALAETLGVSATPIREAMIDLAHSGLVEPVRNRGFRILTVSDEDLDEIVELRLMVEVPPLATIVEKATDQQLADLDAFLEPTLESARQGDIAAYVLNDSIFHIALLKLAGNQRLIRLVSELRDQTRLLGLCRLDAPGQLEQSALEHSHILKAVQTRDAELASTLLARHIRHARGIWAGRPENAPVHRSALSH